MLLPLPVVLQSALLWSVAAVALIPLVAEVVDVLHPSALSTVRGQVEGHCEKYVVLTTARLATLQERFRSRTMSRVSTQHRREATASNRTNDQLHIQTPLVFDHGNVCYSP